MKQIFTLFVVFVVVFAQRNRNQGNNENLVSGELPTEPEDRILVADDEAQIDKTAERPTEQLGNENQKDKIADTGTTQKSKFKHTKPHFSNATELKDWIFSSELNSRKIKSESEYEYEGYDGWYNNRAHSSLGSIDSTLIRILPAEYSDGVYKPAGAKRPHPIQISDQLFHGELGSKSNTGKTALLVYFGQQVVEEILDSRRPSCPPEYIHLDVPKDHLYYKTMKHTKMSVIRSRYDEKSGHSPNNPRQQLNEFTPWIDGGIIYGISKSWSNLLRSFKGGKLKSSETDHLLPVSNKVHLPMYNHPPPGVQNPKLLPITRFHSLGNPWGNESPFLLTIGVLWFRWHNFIASSLAEIHKDWSDEKLYNEARKWVIASQQQIIINEWLPAWLGVSLPEYSKYDPSIDPSISHVFQSAAMRFGHTLVPGGGYKRSRNCSTKATIIRTCNAYWDANKYLLNGGFEELILGLASQAAEEEDIKIVEDLRLYLFGSLEFTRRDLIAINIARGRDHGLPNYLAARKALGLKYDFKKFDELAKELWPKYYKDKKLLSKVQELYKDVREIDIWVGGMLETNGYQPGEMFLMITLDQFRRIRDGDRFWFENKQNGLFTDEEIEIIQQLSIYDIITSVTDIKEQELQSKPFILPNDKGNTVSAPFCMEEMQKNSYDCTIDVQQNIKAKCFSLLPINKSLANEACTEPKTFDYILGSEVSYITTFAIVAIFIIACFGVQLVLVHLRKSENHSAMRQNFKQNLLSLDKETTLAYEWDGHDDDPKAIQIEFERRNKSIVVKLYGGKSPIRQIDLRNASAVHLEASTNASDHFVLMRIPKEYDLILKFDTYEEKEQFISKIDMFLGEISVGRERREVDAKKMLRNAYTKEKRKAHLETFFKAIFSHAFGISSEKDAIDARKAKEIINTELTPYEFAEVLALRPDSLFVQQMFALVDKDNNGYISFREFLDMMVIFAKGSADQKAKLMFDMYDINRVGKLTKSEFSLMIRSMLELANQTITTQQLEQLIQSMYDTAGLTNKNELDLSDFLKLLGDFKDDFGYVELNLDVSSFQGLPAPTSAQQRRRSALIRANDTVVRAYSFFGGNGPAAEKKQCEPTIKVSTQKATKEPGPFTQFVRFVDEHKAHIFWMFLYTAILVYVFIDKAYYYTFEKEDGGLRRVAGLGVTVTRGAASVMMFVYSTLLLTVSRNIITFVRETFLHRYIPFDSAIFFHKYIACIGLVFSLIHAIGHAINFYHIGTQPPEDISCLFREFHHNSDELPKFSYWCFQTITGFTGIWLLLMFAVLYIFAMRYSRRYIFNAFWATHNMYPAIYLIMICHGLGRLVQPPIFYKFLIVPVIIFTIDRLISISRKKIELSVVRAVHHPSEVTNLEFKRPPNFEYKSGQWMRIACVALNRNEYHPFTIASAPHEDNLQLFIRAVGPFTKNIRQTFDPNKLKNHPYPKLYVDGPYGEGHQDWFRYEVSVLVGGGIGVTPFASILKDIAFRSASTIHSKTVCKKVFFVWVTRTQKQFEWLIDIIRDVEKKDTKNLVNTHIFITQFYEKFDLRTTMLYICERHFQKISNKSLFTGLTAKTHFGRPDFTALFESLQNCFPEVNRIGVFSCGPPPMTRSVQKGCEALNRKEGAIFIHHYENF